MIARHTFKQLIETVAVMEAGIEAFEKAVNCHIDDNWMTNGTSQIIRAIAEGFFEEPPFERSLEDCQSETIEELLYHFIYMEDCGNDSEHCRSKLIIMDEGKESQQSIPCTNLDELYSAIELYLNTPRADFTFNYCHSCKDEEDNLK